LIIAVIQGFAIISIGFYGCDISQSCVDRKFKAWHLI